MHENEYSGPSIRLIKWTELLATELHDRDSFLDVDTWNHDWTGNKRRWPTCEYARRPRESRKLRFGGRRSLKDWARAEIGSMAG